MNSIVTFYSYKGGAGRTMALANIAVLLAQDGLKVLAVDFDLEAPGLDRYFLPEASQDIRTEPGVIDLLTEAARQPADCDWRKYKKTLNVGEVQIDIMSAGKAGPKYNDRVLRFDWDHFFTASGGGDFLENLREEWKETYEVVLIDSRTGITDSGGVCTILLPDVLIPVITPNEQSLYGTKEIIQRAQEARQQLEYDRPPLLVYPLASRFDTRTEFELSRHWLRLMATQLRESYGDWLPSSYAPMSLLERTKLPYVPYFSFGEKLPVLTDSLSDPQSLGYAYRATAKLLREDFSNASEIFKEETLLPIDEKDRLRAFALQAEDVIGNWSKKRQTAAWSVLLRLAAESLEKTTRETPFLPSDVFEEFDNTISDLRSLGVVLVRGDAIAIVDADLIEAWDGLKQRLWAESEFLNAMKAVRGSAKSAAPMRDALPAAMNWGVNLDHFGGAKVDQLVKG